MEDFLRNIDEYLEKNCPLGIRKVSKNNIMNQDETYLNAHEKEYVEVLRKPEVQFKQNNQTQSKVTMIETVN